MGLNCDAVQWLLSVEILPPFEKPAKTAKITTVNISETISLMKPLLLDLFCGAGGAALGYYRAGFEILGVDINPQPRYPFRFIQADALDFDLNGFDVVHASPPCQRWVSVAYNGTDRSKDDYSNFIFPIRQKFAELDVPSVIENVQGAPLNRNHLILCGTMFPNLRVLRHRHFEIANAVVPQPSLENCEFHPPVYTRDKRSKNYGKFDPTKDYVSVFGNSSCRKEHAEAAMGIDWMNKGELVEAIPPDYSEYIGKYLLQQLSS